MKLFQYVILLHPTKEKNESGEISKMLTDVKTILAKDQNMALMMAAREIPQEHVDKLDCVEIAIRPF